MKRGPQAPGAFTLVEILVSTAVLAFLLLILLSITTQVSNTWRQTSGKTEQFRQAREAFDAISRRLGRATLNTYWDYDDPANPTKYVRQSELRFVGGPTEDLVGAVPGGKRWPGHGVFFQSALGAAEPGQTNLVGLNSLLNTWGYFVEFGSDAAYRPGVLDGSVVPNRWRFRLCELIQPADDLSIYQYTSGTNSAGTPKNLSYAGTEWFEPSLAQADSSRPVHVLAENVIAMVILPKLSPQEDPSGTLLAPNYLYRTTDAVTDPAINPKNQLPPLAQVTMVVIDENSARRIEAGTSMPELGLDQLFQNAAGYEADLATLEKTLSNLRLSYRVFTTTVRLNEAKWSKEQ
jgi:uncharacterized protein (TIGR02599 family)